MKQPFILPIADEGLHLYELAIDYSYSWIAEGEEWSIFIPAGFQYDGISNPRFFWMVTGITPDGLGRAAALVHDWIYRHAGALPKGSFLKDGRNCVDAWSREQTDKLFANMLDRAGVSKFRRRLMYLGVRIGGWMFWRK